MEPDPEPPSPGTSSSDRSRRAIELTDLQSALQVDPDQIRDVAETVLREEGVTHADISIVLVDQHEMRTLNRTHLQHDYNTDVLSFLLDAHQDEDTAAYHIDGEIILSTEYAIESAAKYQTDANNWTSLSELLLYLVHGLLHLTGYDDHEDSDRALMRQREKELLALHAISPPWDEVAAQGLPQQTPPSDRPSETNSDADEGRHE